MVMPSDGHAYCPSHSLIVISATTSGFVRWWLWKWSSGTVANPNAATTRNHRTVSTTQRRCQPLSFTQEFYAVCIR
jgi:hypothetical protein